MARFLVCFVVLLIIGSAVAQKAKPHQRQVARPPQIFDPVRARDLGPELIGPLRLPTRSGEHSVVRWSTRWQDSDVSVGMLRHNDLLVGFSVDINTTTKPSTSPVEVLVIDRRSNGVVFRGTTELKRYQIANDRSAFEATGRTEFRLSMNREVIVEIHHGDQVLRSPVLVP